MNEIIFLLCLTFLVFGLDIIIDVVMQKIWMKRANYNCSDCCNWRCCSKYCQKQRSEIDTD